MSDTLSCTVLHLGVPIGTVDLRLDGAQGLGTLKPLPAFSSVRWRIILASALGPRARVELLTRRAEDIPSHPVIAKACLDLSLVDQLGVAVPADIVRLVQLRTRAGVTVLVDLRMDAVGEPAVLPFPWIAVGNDHPIFEAEESENQQSE